MGRNGSLAKKCAVKGAGLQRVKLPPGNWFAAPDGAGAMAGSVPGSKNKVRPNLVLDKKLVRENPEGHSGLTSAGRGSLSVKLG